MYTKKLLVDGDSATIGIGTRKPVAPLHVASISGIATSAIKPGLANGTVTVFGSNNNPTVPTFCLTSLAPSLRFGTFVPVVETAGVHRVALYDAEENTIESITQSNSLLMTKDLPGQYQCATWKSDAVNIAANVGFNTTYEYAFGNVSGGAVALQMFYASDESARLDSFGNFANVSYAGYRFGYSITGRKLLFTYDGANTQTVLATSSATLSANTVYKFSLLYNGATTWTYNVSNATTTVWQGTVVDSSTKQRMTSTVPNEFRIVAGTGLLSSKQTVANIAFQPVSRYTDMCLTGNSWQVLANASTVPALAVSTENGGITITANAAPVTNGQLTFNLLNNTTLQLQVRGTDGVLRTGTVTLT